MNITSLVNTQGPISVANGLILYWSFNENSGSTVYDLSGYNNHGNFTASNLTAIPTWDITGSKPHMGSEMVISSTGQCVTSNRILDMDISSSGTVSFWFMCNTIGNNQYVCGNGNWSTDRNGFNIAQQTAGTLIFEVCNNATKTTGTAFGQVTGSIWRMITISWDNTNFKYYINGAFLNSNAATVKIAPNVYPFSIAKDGSNTAAYRLSTGYFDEVRVYNRALNADEVYKLYKETGG
jgi:hypothetical protein